MFYIFNSFDFPSYHSSANVRVCVCICVQHVFGKRSFAPYYLMRTIGFRLKILEEENILIALTLLELS